MPFQVDERSGSRAIESGDRPSVGLRYTVIGTDDGTTDDTLDSDGALTALEAAAPATFAGLPRSSVRVEPSRQTVGLWEGEAVYTSTGGSQPPEPEPPLTTGLLSTSFASVSGSQNVKRGLSEISVRGREDQVDVNGTTVDFVWQFPDGFDKQIGVNPDGSVDGIDIPTVRYTLRETWGVTLATGTAATNFRKTLRANAMHVNSDANFRGFAAGEVLFTGGTMDLERSANNLWRVTMNFDIRANETITDANFPDAAGTSDNIDVDGWDVLWYQTQEIPLADGASVAQKAIAQVVTRPLPRTSLSSMMTTLGLS